MAWTGLSAQTLLVAAVAGVAGLVLLFLLRPRPRLLQVSSHVLWKKVLPRRMNPLVKELVALLLQILALLAVLGALGRPEPVVEELPPVEEAGVARPRDRIVVVDCSASMGAVDEAGRSRMDRVREDVEALIAQLAEGERMALVTAAGEAAVVVPLTSDAQRLGLAARTLRVLPTRADLEGALAQARILLEDASRPAELRVFADSAIQAPPLPEDCALVWAPVGTPRPNVAVTAFDVRASEGLPARLEAFVELTSYAPMDARVTVSVETATRVLGRASYTLPAEDTLARVYQFAPPEEDRVEVVLREVEFLSGDAGDGEVGAVAPVATDALAVDDQAYAFLPVLRPARVLLVSRGNRYLQAALQLIPGLRLDVVAPDEYSRGRVASGYYDVVFYDSFVPDDTPRVNSFFINPPQAVAGFSVERRVEAPAITDWNLGHPLFASLVLRELNVAVSGQFDEQPGDVRLIGTPTGPIAVAHEVGGARQVAFGFDFADSDLPLRVGFPQLIFNTVLWMREGRATGSAPGRQQVARDPLWLRPAVGVDSITVERMVDPGQEPARRALEVPAGDGALMHHFDRVGFFQVSGAEDERPVAVSLLDARESDLRATPRWEEPPPTPAPAVPVEGAEPMAPPWVWLGLAALLLMVGEFGVINR